MNSRQRIVQQSFLDDEAGILRLLYRSYSEALEGIKAGIEEKYEAIAELTEDINDLPPNDPKRVVLEGRRMAKVYQKQYQESLERQVSGILGDMDAKNYANVMDYLEGCYDNGFLGAMYDIHGQGIPLTLPINQQKAVHAVQTDSKISEGLYRRLGKDTADLKRKITSQVSRSMVMGESYGQCAQALERQTEIGFNRAARIARTEGHRIQVTAAMDALYDAREAGADVVKQWDATLDKRTRRSHARCDGEIREIDDPFGNGLMCPGDPEGPASEVVNCRCALLQRARWGLDEDELATLKERAAYFGLDKADSFEEFKERYLSTTISEARAAEPPVRVPGSFAPAKTIDEAQKFAMRFVQESGFAPTFKNSVSYKGIDLEIANEVNRALYDVYGMVDIPKISGIKAISATSAKGKKIFTDADAIAAYNFAEQGIFLNKDVLKSAKAFSKHRSDARDAFDYVVSNRGRLTGARRELADRYAFAGRSLVDDSVRGAALHELGHHVDWNMAKRMKVVRGRMERYACGLSGYAGSNAAEYMAESFVAYMNGELGKIDPEFDALMKPIGNSASGDGAFGNAFVSGVRGELLANQVHLPKKEYGKVMHSINNVYHAKYAGKTIGTIAIAQKTGTNLYTFLINDFDDYVVIEKEKI